MKFTACTLVLAALAATALAGPGDPANARLNEIYISHAGTDDFEMVELIGTAGASLFGYAVCVVEGEGASASGTLDRVYDLNGFNFDVNGYFVLADTAEPNKDFDLGASNSLENGTNTYYLVNSANVAAIAGLLNTQIDGDNDGVSDITLFGTIVDAVAVVEPDWHAGIDRTFDDADVVGPDATFLPAGVFRSGDYPGKWATAYLDFDDVVNANLPRTPKATNTTFPIRTYGSPNCNSGGPNPFGYRMRLFVNGDTTSGTGSVNIELSSGPPGALAGLFVGPFQGDLVLGTSCEFLLNPPFISIFFPLGGINPGEGSIVISPVAVPAGLSGVTVYLQGAADNGGGKYVESNGIEMELL